MKTSQIKRLIPKKLAQRISVSKGRARTALEAQAESESAETIAKMKAKGYRLATRLETGEGVFVRELDVVGLHVQLPRALHRRLDAECRRREVSKRQLVIDAIERVLTDARG